MDISQTKTVMSNAVTNFVDICPHCNTKAHLQMLFLDSYLEKNRDLIYYVIFKCVPCKKLILETARFNQNKYSNTEDLNFTEWQDKFPTESTTLVEKFKGIVPDDILIDFEEGLICLQNKCYKSSVGMFRRSLQSALLNLGANPTNDLVDQIKNLKSLTPEIKDWAHNIRIFGNWGVHPQDDNLKDINFDKASETQSFLEEFFNYIYVMPDRVAKARKPAMQPETTG